MNMKPVDLLKIESSADSRARVLLADDHAVLREGLRLVIERSGNFVIAGEAGSGLEAIDKACELRPDIIVMDINMPLLNGIEAAREIKRRHPAIEIVILSMCASAEHVHTALSAGARAYVLKESVGAELVQAMNSVRAGKRFLTAAILDVLVDSYLWLKNETIPADGAGPLTKREREVMKLVVEGKTSKEIASILHLAIGSVNSHRHRLMKKLGVNDAAGLVRHSMNGLNPSIP